MKLTTFDQFVELARRGTFVPVCKEVMADLLTPVSAFLKIAEHSDYAFLLESVEGGEHVGRYSFLGKDPLMVVRAREDGTLIERAGQTEQAADGFMPTVRRLMAALEPYSFDQIYGAWFGQNIMKDAKAALRYSAERYIAAISSQE